MSVIGGEICGAVVGPMLPCRRVLTTSRGWTARVDMTPAVKPAIVSMSDGGNALLVLMDQRLQSLLLASSGRVTV